MVRWVLMVGSLGMKGAQKFIYHTISLLNNFE